VEGRRRVRCESMAKKKVRVSPIEQNSPAFHTFLLGCPDSDSSGTTGARPKFNRVLCLPMPCVANNEVRGGDLVRALGSQTISINTLETALAHITRTSASGAVLTPKLKLEFHASTT
jgi:hypothetical protein